MLGTGPMNSAASAIMVATAGANFRMAGKIRSVGPSLLPLHRLGLLAMALYKEQGIILRTMRLGESDRIVTVMTQGAGKIRAVAKGVRKTKSRWGARLEPFTHVDLVLYKGRELDIVTQAQILSPFPLIRADYSRFAAGEVILEATDRIAQDHEKSVRLFMLLLGALRALSVPDEDPVMVVDSYLLRLASLSGFRPALAACAVCGRPGPHPRFSVTQGGVVCDSCRAGASAIVGEGAMPYLESLLNADWSSDTPEVVRKECSGLIRAYVEYHFDRPLRSWMHVPR
ncbi:MAG: DNA repair protein RecO [Actinomycetota bacterium]